MIYNTYLIKLTDEGLSKVSSDRIDLTKPFKVRGLLLDYVLGIIPNSIYDLGLTHSCLTESCILVYNPENSDEKADVIIIHRDI